MKNSDNSSTFSIFGQTQACLHNDFLSQIPTSVDQSSVFIEIAEELQLTFCEQINDGCLVFLGMWNNLLKAEERLKECLRSWDDKKYSNVKSSEEVSILIPESYIQCVLPAEESHLYLEHSDSEPSQRPQLLPSIKTKDEKNQILPKHQEDTEVKELYVDIAVKPNKKSKSDQDHDFEISSEQDKNPLDKLCQLLCIDEDESIEKSLSIAEKRRNYEESLPYKYFCDQCSFKAKRENHLVKHTMKHNENKVVYCCEKCDFKTICERTLSRHKVIHSACKLACKDCSFVTDNRNALQRHMLAKHGPNYAKCVKCRQCDFMTNKPREMIHHLKLLHSETQTAPIWKCSKCPYKSKLRAHLNRHVNDVHEGVRKFLCQYCGKKFKRNETLIEHKATHGELTQSFTCQFCDKAFPKSFQLQQHMITHSTERPYLCDMCGKSYKTIQATERHKRFMHSENVPKWPCPRGCERTFKYRTHLSKHLKRPCKISIRMKQLKSGVRESDVEEEVVASHITIQIVCDEQLDNNIKNVA